MSAGNPKFLMTPEQAKLARATLRHFWPLGSPAACIDPCIPLDANELARQEKGGEEGSASSSHTAASATPTTNYVHSDAPGEERT